MRVRVRIATSEREIRLRVIALETLTFAPSEFDVIDSILKVL
jgi:hypothetical protein